MSLVLRHSSAASLRDESETLSTVMGLRERQNEGLVRFSTEPWPDTASFLDHRKAFDRWRTSAGTCLKTSEDWHRFLSWKVAPRSGAASARTQFANAVVAAFAHGLPGFPVRGRGRYGTGMSRSEVASWLASVGIEGMTAKTFENSREREADPTGTVTLLTPGDHELIDRLVTVLSRDAIISLLAEDAAQALKPSLAPTVMTITLIPSTLSEVPNSADPHETPIAGV